MRWPVPAPVLGACIILIAAAAVTAAEPPAYREQIRFADGLFSRRMYALAAPEYEALLEDFPDGDRNDTATFRLAESYRFSGEMSAAARWYDRLVVAYPDSPYRLRAAYRRARLYMDAGDALSAVEHFRAVLAENPDPDVASASLYHMGEGLLALERTGEAEATFALILRRHPDSVFAAYARMQQASLSRDRWGAAREQGDEESARRAAGEALERYAAVIELEAAPDRLAAEALFRSADMHFAAGDYARSAEFYRRLLERYPEDERAAESRLQAAWASANAGMYAEALQLATPAIETATGAERVEWLYLKANCERQLMQHERAVATYRHLLDEAPSGPRRERARYELALSLYKLERYAEAIREAGIIVGVEALQADVAWLLAESHAALNQADQAIQFYRIVLRTAPDSPIARDAIYRLAYQLQVQGQEREAARFYTMLVDRFPEDPLAPQALFAAGIALENAGEDTAAARDWGRLVEAYPESRFAEEALFRKALAEIRAGREREGGEALEQYLPRYPEGRFTADVHYWRGVLLSRAGRYRDAKTMLEQALNLSPRLDLEREALLQLGTVQQRLNDDAAAARTFGRLLGTEAEDRLEPSLLEWLAGYHAGQGDDAAALQAAGALVARGDDPAWLQAGWTLQGRIRLRQGDAETAEGLLRRALEADARTRYGAEAALLLAGLLLDADQPAAAEPYYREAARRATSEATLGIRVRALFGLGRSAGEDGRALDAARHFMSVAILFDDDAIVPESLYRAAAMFDAAGRTDEARAARNELAERYPESIFTRRVTAEEPPS